MYDLWSQKELVPKKFTNKKGNKILMILKVKAEMSEAFCIARVLGLNNTLCMCTYTCVCRRGIFACLLTGKVLLRLCVLHNSVVREYNLYMRHSFHPCSLHFISWGFNECNNKKTAELPEAVIMSVFISKVRLGLFGAGWKNFKEKKRSRACSYIVHKAASTISFCWYFCRISHL